MAFGAEPTIDLRDHPALKRVAVVGAGYVGLTLAACLARNGHQVHCTDTSEERVERLRAGIVPIVEEGLTEIVERTVAEGRLRFGTDNVEAAGGAEYVFRACPRRRARTATPT